MAANPAEKPKSTQSDSTAVPPSRSLLPIIGIALVVAALTAGGIGWYFIHHLAPPAPTVVTIPATANYFSLEPAFVVNLSPSNNGDQHDEPHYLQVEVQLMTRHTETVAALQTHAPAIRAKLLLLFSQITAEQIADRQGKEQLQAEALAQVQALLQAETGSAAVDELLFTSFITQ